MSTNFKLNIQLFSGTGEGVATWDAGISKSAIEAALSEFNTKIQAAVEAINNYANVDAALQAGWQGQDCTDFIEKYHKHAESIVEQIEVYQKAVQQQVGVIMSEWEQFQAKHIS